MPDRQVVSRELDCAWPAPPTRRFAFAGSEVWSMSRSKFRYCWLVLVVASAGCTTILAPAPDPSSPFYRVPEGSVVELRQALEVRPGTTRTWLQFGQALGGRFDRYAPNCNFEIWTIDHERSQHILPGDFVVRRVQNVREEVVRADAPLRLAAWRLAEGGIDGGGPSMVYEGYHLWLENPQQRDVRRLTCRGAFADPWEAYPPSIDEMRAALGKIATLRLP
jgi:hypothetical protein